MIKSLPVITSLLLLHILAGCSGNQANQAAAATVLTKEADTAVATNAVNAVDLPSFVVKDTKGQLVSLESLKGKKLFVNLWASWCPPCRAEMPSIEKLSAEVDKDHVFFLLLSLDENSTAASDFVRENHISLPVYFPAAPLPSLFRTEGIPATFIFDEHGRLLTQHLGEEDYNTDAYRQLLK
jgi:thiol-disulfide isomerase/thioredoxin